MKGNSKRCTWNHPMWVHKENYQFSQQERNNYDTNILALKNVVIFSYCINHFALLNFYSKFSFSSWRIRAYLITIPPCFLAWYTVAYSWNSFHLFCFANCVSIAHNCSTYTQYGFVRKVFFFSTQELFGHFANFQNKNKFRLFFSHNWSKFKYCFL